MWTDFGGGVTRTAAWRQAVNAMGEIPVLEADGESLTQSGPILLRLAEQYGRFGGPTNTSASRCALAVLGQPEALRFHGDLSMCGYLSFPMLESGYHLLVSHPAVHAWLQRIAALPGWQAPYDLLSGKRLRRYAGAP